MENIANFNIFRLVISVDRMEKGKTAKSAIQELEEEYGIKTYSIVTIKEVVEYLHNRKVNGEIVINNNMKKRVEDYLLEYGA